MNMTDPQIVFFLKNLKYTFLKAQSNNKKIKLPTKRGKKIEAIDIPTDAVVSVMDIAELPSPAVDTVEAPRVIAVKL